MANGNHRLNWPNGSTLVTQDVKEALSEVLEESFFRLDDIEALIAERQEAGYKDARADRNSRQLRCKGSSFFLDTKKGCGGWEI